MGQDYNARKSAKKGRKRMARDGGDGDRDAQGKRIRKKKNQPRRMCRGPCFQPPALTDEDRAWDGREGGDGSDDFDIDVARGGGGGGDEGGFAVAPAAVGGGGGGAASDSDDEAAIKKHKERHERKQRAEEERRREKKAAAAAAGGAGVKMSTSVRLLDPAALAEQARAIRDATGGGAAGAAGGAAARPAGVAAPEDAPESLKAFPAMAQACMVALGYSEPTPIQAAAWPPACGGRDVQAVAEPGSGKTLGYLIPAFMRIHERRAAAAAAAAAVGSGGGGEEAAAARPLALVLAPTRELAAQVAQQARALRGAARAACAVVYGGVLREQQVQALRSNPPLLVATPGRLLDLVDAGEISLGSVACVVLDEADKMLNLGFAPQLDRLRAMLLPAGGGAGGAGAASASLAGKGQPAKKKKKKGAEKEGGGAVVAAAARPQVLLFTATMPAEVEAAAAAWLAPGAERVRSAASAASISTTITQVVHVCAEHKKPAKLLKHLAAIREASAGARNPPRVLVFANRVKAVKFLLATVTKDGWRADALHGQRSQAERDAAVAKFRAGKVQVLVASDVASRGLDIRGLPYVVNYDFPSRLEVYVHRVGRTGRLASGGHAYSFFTRNLAKLAPDLVTLLQHHGQPVDPNLARLAEAWQEAGKQLAAAGQDPSRLAAGGVEEEDEEEEGGAAGAGGVAEDLQEGLGNAAAAPAAPAGGRATARAGGAPDDVFARAMGELLVEEGRAGDGYETDATDATAATAAASDGEGAACGKAARKRKAGDAGGQAAAPGHASGLAAAARQAFGQLLERGAGAEGGGGAAAAAAAAPEKKRRKQQGAADMLLVPRGQAGDAGAGGGGAGGGVSIAPAAFQPSPKFAGARPGFVFKKGDRGVGYYPDPKARGAAAKQAQRQQQQQQQPATNAKKAAVKAKAQQQDKQKALPPLPGTKAARRSQAQELSDSSDGDDSDGGGGGGPRAGGGWGGLGGGAGSGSGGDSSGDEARGGGFRDRQQAAGRRKALPGRLRKKIAKQKHGKPPGGSKAGGGKAGGGKAGGGKPPGFKGGGGGGGEGRGPR